MSRKEVAALLEGEKIQQRFEVAPQWMGFEQEKGFALQILDGNDFLKNVATNNPGSLLSAMANVAACGLSLNPAKQEAYLVPRAGKVCLDPSYKGLVRLATDTGSVVWVQTKLVYSGDQFTVNGVDEKPTHQHDPFCKDRGEIVGVYTVAKTHDGAFLTETMSIEEVYAIRDRSEAVKAYNTKKANGDWARETPWQTDAGEMIRKTCTKRASKMWPKSDNYAAQERLAAAIQVSHDNDEIVLPQVSTPQVMDYNDEQKAYFDQLIEQNDALEMYVFQRETPESVFINLYNSFPRGEKGKYKQIVDALTMNGQQMFADYVDGYRDASEREDTDGLQELQAECSETAWNAITEAAA